MVFVNNSNNGAFAANNNYALLVLMSEDINPFATRAAIDHYAALTYSTRQ